MKTPEENTGGLSKDGRTRLWTFVAYPESAPENWRGILDSEHIPWIESPLHEGEMNPDNETEKKAHWHILLLFDGKKSYDFILDITKKIKATIPQPCKNAKGLVRYMAHLDNPEKKKYSTSDIIGHGGADPQQYLKATGAARYELIREMQYWIRKNGCTEMLTLLDYAAEVRFDDWYPLLCDSSAYILGEYIKSCYFISRDARRQKERDDWEELRKDFQESDKRDELRNN